MREPVQWVHKIRGSAARSWRQRRYPVVYQVLLDDETTDPYYAAFASALPQLGDQHPVDRLAYVVNIDAQPEEKNRALYNVTVEYQTVFIEPPRGAGSAAAANPAEDPLDDPPDIRVEFIEEATVASEDRDGNPVINSARDWFDPPIEKQRYRPCITIIRNEALTPFPTSRTHLGTTNDASITIAGITFAEDEARMVELSGQKCERLGNDYYQVTYRILGCPSGETHAVKVVDQGYNYLVGATKASILDSEGQRVSEPQRLNGAGAKLAPDAAPGATVFDTFNVYPQADWSTLNLPTTE